MKIDGAPIDEAPAQDADPEPRVRLEQWGGERERRSAGMIELLMAFVRREEEAGHIMDLASVFEQQFQAFCNEPVA